MSRGKHPLFAYTPRTQRSSQSFLLCIPAFLAGSLPCTLFLYFSQGPRPATQRSLQGFPPCTRRPLLKKGSIRKLFLWTGDILFMEGRRIRNAGSVDFREPIYGHRAPSPLWCFVLSCMVGGILRKPLGFRRCLPPARPEKAWPFQAGQSPCTKHPRFSGFAFTNLKKFLRVPRGVFSKTLLGRGWDSVPQRESEPAIGVRLFRRDKVPARNTPDCPASPLRTEKVFEGSKGRFFKNAPWQGVGQGPTKEEGEPVCKVRLFRRDEVLSRNIDRPSGLAFTLRKKFLRVPRGVFSKTLLGRGWDSVPQKEGEPAHRGAPFQSGQSPFTKHRQIVRLCLYAPKKVFEGSKGRFFKNAPWQGVGQGPTVECPAFLLLFRLHRFFRIQFGTIHA